MGPAFVELRYQQFDPFAVQARTQPLAAGERGQSVQRSPYHLGQGLNVPVGGDGFNDGLPQLREPATKAAGRSAAPKRKRVASENIASYSAGFSSAKALNA